MLVYEEREREKGRDNCSRHKAKSESCLPINCSKVSTHLFSSTWLSSFVDTHKDSEKKRKEKKNDKEKEQARDKKKCNFSYVS